MKDKKQGKQEKEWHFRCKLPYVYPNISVTKMAMQGQLLLTSAKGGHQTVPNGGTVYNNTGSSGGSPGTAEDDEAINNSKAVELYEWD